VGATVPRALHDQDEQVQLSLTLDAFAKMQAALEEYDAACAAAGSQFAEITPAMAGRVRETTGAQHAEMLALLTAARTGVLTDPCSSGRAVRATLHRLDAESTRLIDAARRLFKSQDVFSDLPDGACASLLEQLEEARAFLSAKAALWHALELWRATTGSLRKATLTLKDVHRVRLTEALAAFDAIIELWERRPSSSDPLSLTTATPEEVRRCGDVTRPSLPCPLLSTTREPTT